MKRSLHASMLLALALTSCGGLSSARPQGTIVGRWEFVQDLAGATSPDLVDAGLALEFFPGGGMIFEQGAQGTHIGTYTRRANDQVVLNLPSLGTAARVDATVADDLLGLVFSERTMGAYAQTYKRVR